MKKLNRFIYIFIFALIVIGNTPKESSALLYPFSLSMSGAQENPPNASPGTGNISGLYDDATKTLTFNITFSGLIGTTTASHFHAPAGVTTNAGVIIGNVGFPTGVTSGNYANSYVLTAQQEGWLLTDSVYLNIHSTAFPGGEIRTQMLLDNPLPVELSSFTSIVNANEVILNWTTSSELNNSGFEIERSAVNNEWTKIGNVTGNGTVSTPVNYSYTDKGLSSGTYNYRLKQIDFNGNFEYFNLSNEVNVGIPADYKLSQNYPNPFNPTTKIDYQLPKDGQVSISLYDISGKEIMQLVNDNKPAGYYSVTLNASSLSSGIYFYSISSNGFVNTKKLMLVK